MEVRVNDYIAAFERADSCSLRQLVMLSVSSPVNDCVLHPLGFYLIRLGRLEELSIRLHFWPEGLRERGTALTPYHDHVWTLESCVLVGGLDNILLDVFPDDTGSYQLAEINQQANVDDVLPSGQRVSLHIQSRETYKTGDFYSIPPRVFHYTAVSSETATVTVVKSMIAVPGGPRTLVPLGSSGHMPTRESVACAEMVTSDILSLLRKQ